MNNKIKRLEFDYQPNNVKEKEETNSVLMHAKELLEYRDKIIKAFEKGFFFVWTRKRRVKNAGEFVVEEVSSFIQKIKSKLKNINLSLFNEFWNRFRLIIQSILLS